MRRTSILILGCDPALGATPLGIRCNPAHCATQLTVPAWRTVPAGHAATQVPSTRSGRLEGHSGGWWEAGDATASIVSLLLRLWAPGARFGGLGAWFLLKSGRRCYNRRARPASNIQATVSIENRRPAAETGRRGRPRSAPCRTHRTRGSSGCARRRPCRARGTGRRPHQFCRPGTLREEPEGGGVGAGWEAHDKQARSRCGAAMQKRRT